MISRHLLIPRSGGYSTRLPLSRLVSQAQRPSPRLHLLAARRASPPLARWYSDAAPSPAAQDSKAQSTGAAAPAGGAAKEPAESSDVQALRKELEAKNKEIATVKDSYLRVVADYRNLQDRTKREAKATRDFALQGFVKDLLMSIDNIEHALLSVPADKLTAPGDSSAEQVHQDLVNIHKGLQLTEAVLMGVLNKHGVTRVDPAGQAFDPNLHEAVFHAPMEGKKNGDVMHTQQKGFLLNGRVIRAAQVGVVKNPS